MFRHHRYLSIILIKEAYEKALMHDSSRITDDAMVVEDYGNHEVWLYEGSYKNIKNYYTGRP